MATKVPTPDLTITRHGLSDGSFAEIEDDGRQAMITRWVDGSCVWGQVFSANAEAHPAQVVAVLRSMRENPGAFTRRDLWDENGRAVEWKEAAQ